MIYNVADAFADEHYWQRGTIARVPTEDLGELATQGVIPRLTVSPGRAGPMAHRIGRDNEEIYCGSLGISHEELARLAASGVV